ncbi:MAG: efflux RND transporter periplasmic adaptor subunit [Deltaproteobacteria bacterium]|nr:efflux RND transporter periplasmic adaptor subunit [Deltaproteobacteria bacterium]MBW2418457.1 efflux RND transporter periplasmic adaptor subunit [Deltaproteobacteria bacterium]
MNRMVLVVVLILAVGAAGVALLVSLRPTIEAKPPLVKPPRVRVEYVEPQELELRVRTHGTVMPRSESSLIPQVSGPVVWVSPALASGGYFQQGEPLVRIERADYEVELESARASVARSESEHERASKELERQKRLADRSVASETRYDDARNAERIARAVLREARAKLEKAERDLLRTELLAPYAGRVRDESVDVGQFVTRGAPIASIYAVDYAEVRLPIPDSELRYIDLPLIPRGHGEARSRPVVILEARFAGEEHSWTGRIVRTEGEIDVRSRMVHVIAQVKDPYGLLAGAGAESGAESGAGDEGGSASQRARAPLVVGLFVEAQILGRRLTDVVVLPRAALRDGTRVLVVDGDDRMHFRPVETLRVERDQVVIGAGLARGERVCVSPLQAVVDGMRVRVVGGEAPMAARGAAP